MNHPTQFARSITPRVAAKAADARPSLLQASAATLIIDDQTKTRHRAGQPVRGCDASMPAHRERGPEFLLTRVGSSSKRFFLALALPRNTGREPCALGIFSADGRGCSPAIAIDIKTLGRRDVQSLAQGHPSHFTMSSRSSSDASKIAQKRGQDRGFFSQGRGNVTRARGADD